MLKRAVRIPPTNEPHRPAGNDPRLGIHCTAITGYQGQQSVGMHQTLPFEQIRILPPSGMNGTASGVSNRLPVLT